MTALITEYLKGLGIIVGFLAYIIFFNWAWRKITKENLWGSHAIFEAILWPLLFPVVIVLLLSLPLILGTISFIQP